MYASLMMYRVAFGIGGAKSGTNNWENFQRFFPQRDVIRFKGANSPEPSGRSYAAFGGKWRRKAITDSYDIVSVFSKQSTGVDYSRNEKG